MAAFGIDHEHEHEHEKDDDGEERPAIGLPEVERKGVVGMFPRCRRKSRS
jgi:hypothetical protein